MTMSSGQRRTSMDYYWMNKYDIMKTENEDVLIFKRHYLNALPVRILPREQYYDVLLNIHAQCGHGGRDKVLSSLKNRYYIPKKAVEIFMSLCPTCESKKNAQRKENIVTKPIVARGFNLRGQVDIIDFRSCPDGEFEWLLMYRDNTTEFVNLRPLKTKRAVEVASELMKIFLIFGPPSILQSDNGQEFDANVIKELVAMWPNCKIVHEDSRRPQTQGNFESSNQDIENMLQAWMNENQSTNWSMGCFFVQYLKNSSTHQKMGGSPYKALFGREPNTRLKRCEVPTSILVTVKTEPAETVTSSDYDNNDINSETVMDSTIERNFTCAVCHKETTGANKCEFCNSSVDTKGGEGDSFKVSCSTSKVVQPTSTLVTVKTEPTETTSSQYDSNDNNSNDIVQDESNFTCAVCNKESPGAYKCESCNSDVEATCGITENEGGDTFKVSCVISNVEQDVDVEIDSTKNNHKRGSEEKIDATFKKMPKLDIGNSVFVSVPKVDRGDLNIKNIQGIIVDIQNGVYRVGTKYGTIKNWFSHRELQYSDTSYGDEIQENSISLGDAVAYLTSQSLIGQVFKKCNCKPAVNQCRNNRCACFKNNALCGFKCHGNISCINK